MTICYFSATGNCLSVARHIAEHAKAELISIPALIDQPKIDIADRYIGIVFPTYIVAFSGIPLIIERFIGRLENIGSKYLFAVCTCGGYELVNAYPTLRALKRVIRSAGGRLAAGYTVRLPMNNLDYGHIPIPINKDTDTIIARSRKRLASVVKRIATRKPDPYRAWKAVFNLLLTPMYRMMQKPVLKYFRDYARVPADSPLTYRELVPLSDKSITVNDRCNGCGTCVRVCPVGNIMMVKKKPEWQHHCEMCFACDEWCPQWAVRHWSRGEGVKYHYPGMKAKDFIINCN